MRVLFIKLNTREEEEVQMMMMTTMIVKKKTKKMSSGRHGCDHLCKQASLFNAKSMRIPTRVNAICIAWTAPTEPFARFASLLTETTGLFRYHLILIVRHTHTHTHMYLF